MVISMPIDFEALKRKNGKNAKPKIIKPLIRKEKRNVSTEKEHRKRIIKKLVGDDNMTNQKKRPRKKSGLEKAYNTKQDYDSLFGANNTEVPREAPNETEKLLEMVKNMPNNQGGNNGGNNNILSQMKDIAYLRDFFNPKQQGDNTSMLGIINDNNISARQQQDKHMELMMQKSDDRMMFMMQQLNQSKGQPQENPRDNMRADLKFFREISGDKHQRTKDELEYSLKEKELSLKERSREDILNREERQIIRDDKKSQSILDIGGVVLNKVMGDGVGALINDVMSAGKGEGYKHKKKRRGRASAEEEMDLTLLDDL